MEYDFNRAVPDAHAVERRAGEQLFVPDGQARPRVQQGAVFRTGIRGRGGERGLLPGEAVKFGLLLVQLLREQGDHIVLRAQRKVVREPVARLLGGGDARVDLFGVLPHRFGQRQ